ncbi:MAG: UPF0158 family protein [Bacilli bacterium]
MIKLSEIRDALYDVSMETSCYFNTKTNEILWQWEFNIEESTYTEEDEFNDDIISMFNFYTKNDYDIMQDFISNISNDSLRNELFNATRGKGAFHRFREITDYHNITNDWYKFQDDEYKKIAEEWCTRNKIEYEKDC